MRKKEIEDLDQNRSVSYNINKVNANFYFKELTNSKGVSSWSNG